MPAQSASVSCIPVGEQGCRHDVYDEVMEGPSIHLAAEQLRPFVGRRVRQVAGNSRIGIERFQHKTVRDIFPWGKHLVFQFDAFALRVHFMLGAPLPRR